VDFFPKLKNTKFHPESEIKCIGIFHHDRPGTVYWQIKLFAGKISIPSFVKLHANLQYCEYVGGEI
jgi:hypothetical protein